MALFPLLVLKYEHMLLMYVCHIRVAGRSLMVLIQEMSIKLKKKLN